MTTISYRTDPLTRSPHLQDVFLGAMAAQPSPGGFEAVSSVVSTATLSSYSSLVIKARALTRGGGVRLEKCPWVFAPIHSANGRTGLPSLDVHGGAVKAAGVRNHVAGKARDASSSRRDNSEAEVALQHSLPQRRLFLFDGWTEFLFARREGGREGGLSS